MPDTPRVLVVKMHGSAAGFHNGLWHWRCTAEHAVDNDDSTAYAQGHWTTAHYAHDDGREHARHCAALRLAKLLDRMRKTAKWHAEQVATDRIENRFAHIVVSDVLENLRAAATDA